MAQAKVTFTTFEDYLAYSDGQTTEQRYQFIDGELVELPPESEPNDFVADSLQFYLAIANVVPRRLVKTHTCEVQVPVLQLGDPANRFPDLVVLRNEHLALTQRRLTITLDMPPPRLIAEVVSPGRTNRDRDYRSKRAQYAAISVPEYWLVDPDLESVIVLTLADEGYREVGTFSGSQSIGSSELEGLTLSVDQLFEVGP
ncbi:Uma2 family endonuclease [Nodosilinea nodulosa]|uniref:Uma2 family endonuclease n=1 Tax=Nodosilinea nodulosa TaxID=416001 RepID=UPI0002DAF671|nr:Uma2 family endonuclease [Nodosilinea nodulosa]